MKTKKLISILVAILLCMTISIGTAFAAVPEEDTLMPLGNLAISASLTKVSGTTNTYRAKATVIAYAIEDLSIYVYLYNSAGTLVGSASNSGNGASLTASFNRSLSPGTYKLVANCYGDTSSENITRTYKIS